MGMTAELGAGGGRAWLAALPDELAAQRRVMAGLVDRCAAWPLVTSLLVGCSLGRGAADALSDIDAALGVDTERGEAGAGRVRTVAAMVVAALPDLGDLVDVLRHQTGAAGQFVQRIFAQYADGAQLDLAVVAEAEIEMRRRTGGAPDFIPLYQVSAPPDSQAQAIGGQAAGEPPAAYAVTSDQVREWAFLGWCALIDADKYLRRGSLWEAHDRLHEARHHIWALWAAARGAMYPWHGLSQVLDHDPGNLPLGVESTIAGLDAADLRRATRASAAVLAAASESAARRHPTHLPTAMAGYVTRTLSGSRGQPGLGLAVDGRVVLGQLPQEAGYPAGAEVVVTRPAGLDGDPGHLLVQHPYLFLELAGLPVIHGLGGRGEVLIRDAVDDFDGGHSANLEGAAGRPVVGVDGQRDMRANGQGADLGRDGHGADDDPCAVPVEPDGDHRRKAVGPGVGQPGQGLSGEQLLRAGVVQLPGEGVSVVVRGFAGAHRFLLLTVHAALLVS
jgi:hypothetical protein